MSGNHDLDNSDRAPLIPPVQQPKGWVFFLKTWTGRLVLINTMIFILEMWADGRISADVISTKTLLEFGAKDPILLAQGQWWRYFAPIFIHANFIHFAFNTWGIYAVAYQLEAVLGARRFLLLYFLAGLGGNIASAVWGFTLSVGASGALFGLLGCALYIERRIQSHIKQRTGFKPKAGAFTVMAIANILLGFLIPRIDNAAHMGGLAVGVIFAFLLLRVQPNRLVPQSLRVAKIVGLTSVLIFLMAGYVGSSKVFVFWRLKKVISEAKQPEESYYYLDRWIDLDDGDTNVRWRRLALALDFKDYATARIDLRRLGREQDFPLKFNELRQELMLQQNVDALNWLQSLQL